MLKDNLISPEKYATEHKGLKCPKCASGELAGGCVDIHRGKSFQEVYCLDCGSSWTDEYCLTTYSNFKSGDSNA